MQTLLHVRLVVEVWHLPAVFLVVVVVCVRGMVAGGDALSVRCRSTVVEIHLRTVLVSGRSEHLLGFLPSGRSVGET